MWLLMSIFSRSLGKIQVENTLVTWKWRNAQITKDEKIKAPNKNTESYYRFATEFLKIFLSF